jgi:hypothetical protein
MNHLKTTTPKMHLQYDAHIALARHLGQSSDPRKYLQAFGGRSLLSEG